LGLIESNRDKTIAVKLRLITRASTWHGTTHWPHPQSTAATANNSLRTTTADCSRLLAE